MTELKSMYTFISFLFIVITIFSKNLEAKYVVVQGWPTLPSKYVPLGAVAGVSAWHSENEIYIGQRGLNDQPILVLNRNGNNVTHAFGGDVIGPGGVHGLRVDPQGFVWATDVNQHAVYKFSPDGKLLQTLGTKGKSGNGTNPLQFSEPTDIAFAQDGSIYISDGDAGINNRVVKLNSKFDVIHVIGGPQGSTPGLFHQPHSILLDSLQRLWVADRGNNRTQVFDPNGNYLGEWTCIGTPFGIFLDERQRRFFVSDGTRDVVHLLHFEISASHPKEIGPCQIEQTWGGNGTKPGQFQTPHLISTDKDGNLYVGEIVGQRVQKFIDA